MEPDGEALYRAIGYNKGEIDVDTFGVKDLESFGKKYILTSRRVKAFIAQYPRSFRPVEQNFYHPLDDGSGAYFISCREDLAFNNKASMDLSAYSYHLMANCEDVGIIRAVLRFLPRLFFRVAKNKFFRDGGCS